MATVGDHAALALAPAYVPPLAWGLTTTPGVPTGHDQATTDNPSSLP